MGIKDETPDDKVIFDSVDARMKYSKGMQVDAEHIKNDIVKTESDLNTKLNDILKELELIKYRLDVYFSCDYDEKEEDI